MKNKYIYIVSFALLYYAPIWAQDEIDRTVTVERDYQPTIENSDKISIQPSVSEPAGTPASVNYSTYSSPMKDVESNSQIPLDYTRTSFSQPNPMHGYLRAGVGHSATLFNFNYSIAERKNTQFNIGVHHLGQWGRKTMATSSAGFDFAKAFQQAEVFFGVDAQNIFFTRYGRYFTYTDSVKMTGDFSTLGLNHYKDFQASDKQSQWEVLTKVGVRSRQGEPFQYLVQTGYEAFIMDANNIEHIINTKAHLGWQGTKHAAGGNILVQNHLYSADSATIAGMNPENFYTSLDSTDYHAIKVEPYYAYTSKRFFIHVGVNLDFCIGKGRLFLPSPNVYFEAKLTPDWLALYGGATGNYATSSVREHFGFLRYLHPENEIATRKNRTYTPINAQLGFKIRPQNNLLLDIYAAYNYSMYDVFYRPDSNGYFSLISNAHQHWTIGAKFNYHYQDIVNISLNGFYNIWKMSDDTYYSIGLAKGNILDRPGWGVNFRVDAKIDSKWSLYSDNNFSGGHYALQDAAATNVVKLRPVIDLNLGVQYNINKWLSAFFQLNNFINWKTDVYYSYQSQGINFLTGVAYRF